MVERFNGRISDLVKQTRFASAAELETTLERYLNLYNHHLPQRALNHQAPSQALKKWQAEKPELFVKRVYKQAGLDSHISARDSTRGADEPAASCRRYPSNAEHSAKGAKYRFSALPC